MAPTSTDRERQCDSQRSKQRNARRRSHDGGGCLRQAPRLVAHCRKWPPAYSVWPKNPGVRTIAVVSMGCPEFRAPSLSGDRPIDLSALACKQ